MDVNKSIESASGAIRKLWEKHGIKEPLRFLGFCLSILPVPIIQQAGQVLDRHLSDKAFEAEIDSIWAELKKLNAAVSSSETLELAIQEVAKTIESNAAIAGRVNEFIKKLGAAQKEFSVLTENKSYQEITNSIIHADISKFSAHNGSTNVISNTSITSQVTQLHATDNSQNFVDRTSFKGIDGTTSMDNVVTKGAVQVQGSSVGFGEGGFIGFGVGGMIGFGGNPHEVTLTCPICRTKLVADKRQLAGASSVQCPGCKNISAFDPRSV